MSIIEIPYIYIIIGKVSIMDKFWLLLWASVSELSYSLYISIGYNMFLYVA